MATVRMAFRRAAETGLITDESEVGTQERTHGADYRTQPGNDAQGGRQDTEHNTGEVAVHSLAVSRGQHRCRRCRSGGLLPDWQPRAVYRDAIPGRRLPRHRPLRLDRRCRSHADDHGRDRSFRGQHLRARSLHHGSSVRSLGRAGGRRRGRRGGALRAGRRGQRRHHRPLPRALSDHHGGHAVLRARHCRLDLQQPADHDARGRALQRILRGKPVQPTRGRHVVLALVVGVYAGAVGYSDRRRDGGGVEPERPSVCTPSPPAATSSGRGRSACAPIGSRFTTS